MRVGLLASILGGFLFASAAFAQAPYANGAARITQGEFKRLIASGNVVILDTRNTDVYRLGHIPGAILLPLEGLPDFPRQYSRVLVDLKAAKKPIVAYCA